MWHCRNGTAEKFSYYQIAEIERQEEDSLSQTKELEAMSKDILELQFQKSEIERMANSALIAQRQKIQNALIPWIRNFVGLPMIVVWLN